MTTVASPTTTRIAAPRAIGAGIAGGLVGGVLFGILMAMMNMLPMVAALVGSQEALVGFGVHLAISAGAGLVYGLAVAALPALAASAGAALASGAVYGVIWWVGGALVSMPLMLGMGEMMLVIDGNALASLMGHLVYGVATALVVFVAVRRA